MITLGHHLMARYLALWLYLMVGSRRWEYAGRYLGSHHESASAGRVSDFQA